MFLRAGIGKKPTNTFKFRTNIKPMEHTNKEILDFASFIRKWMPHFELDANNLDIINKLGLWANRNEKFNDKKAGWHIDRGILLFGSVGVGKDEIFRILRKYLSYLRSPYGYTSKIVWKFAAPFSKDGYGIFQGEDSGNMYYEELALTDENTNQPTREIASYYGNKVLIGSEIINMRYNSFKNEGWQTHFSTNLIEEELMQVYGSRCVSRLREMCNFIPITGKDRRGIIAPTFNRNMNTPTPPPARETTLDEHKYNKDLLDKEYKQFCDTGLTSETVSVSYSLLVSYGCNVATDDELRVLMEIVEPLYVDDPKLIRVTHSERERNKRAFVWDAAKKEAVKQFYQRMKQSGAQSIFGEVTVSVDKMVNEVVKNNKNEQ